MRFAYIDSNGNEVPIPSVDALALRIELGAISEDTELYDAQADQWGPAHTHEIFHSLSRAADEDEGFVAPPPPMSMPEPALETQADAEAESPVEDEGLTLADSPETEPEDLGLTLTGDDSEEGDDAPLDLAPETDAPMDLTSDGGLDLAAEAGESDLGGDDLSLADDAPALAGGDDAEEAPAFDFGDMGGGLELEGEFEAPDAAAEQTMNFQPEASGDGLMGDGGLGLADSGGDFGGGLEQAMDFSGGLEGGDGGGGLDLEQPMSEFTPEAPPAWMEEGEGGGEDQVMDFSSMSGAGDPTEADAGDAPRARPAQKSKPSKPKFKKQRNYAGMAVGLVLLGALGAGGYFGWPIVSQMLEGGGEPTEPAIVMPAIDPSLLPQMNELADAAFESWFAEKRAEVGPVTQSPPEQWLAGIYLATATDYEGASEFWLDVDRTLAEVRGLDLAGFHEHYERAMDAAGVDAANREILAERADSGFVASSAERTAAIGLVDDLVAAATGLHDFLVANEASIEYAPATSVTTDPVLEVNTSNEVRAAMQGRIGQVTDALVALDFLELVTADGLWAAALTKVQDAGMR